MRSQYLAKLVQTARLTKAETSSKGSDLARSNQNLKKSPWTVMIADFSGRYNECQISAFLVERTFCPKMKAPSWLDQWERMHLIFD